MPNTPVALQLYTVRDEAAKDFIGVLEKVAAIGYAGVELAGLPIPADETVRVLADLGLAAPSIHAGYQQLADDLSSQIDLGLALGVKYLTCSGLFTELRNSADGFRQAAGELSRAGEELAKHGLGLCYHNHSFEFEKFDGKCAYDILFENSDPRFLKAQVDTYWVRHGGQDPVAYIRRYSGRCPLIHIKDMADDADRSFAEVGNGVLDWKGIFDASQASGVEWYIVEQDTCKGDPMDSVRISLENLKRMGVA